MQLSQEMIDAIVKNVLSSYNSAPAAAPAEKEDLNAVPVGVSNRHIHLTQADVETLFGEGYQLNVLKPLMGDDFAAKETVTIIGPSLKPIENVRVLGPVRKITQVEVSRTDTFVLRVAPPVRPSGDIAGSAGLTIVGPKGVVTIKEGCIIANRHIHMTPADAAARGLKDGDHVDVVTGGERPSRFYDVQIRVSDKFRLEMHIDTDDANAAGIGQGAIVHIAKKGHDCKCGGNGTCQCGKH